MPIPPPPPPGGAPPAPTFSQVKSSPRLLKQEVGEGRSALLSDICQGTRLKKVAVVNDRSAPLLDSKSPTPKSPTPVTDHPYIRLYQYLHQNQPKQQGAPSEDQKIPLSLEQPRGDGANMGGWSPAVGGVPKLKPVGADAPQFRGKPASSPLLAPPPPQHLVSNGPTGSGEEAPELPQRQNSISTKKNPPPLQAAPPSPLRAAPPPLQGAPHQRACPTTPTLPLLCPSMAPTGRRHQFERLHVEEQLLLFQVSRQGGKPPPRLPRRPVPLPPPPPPPPALRNGHSSCSIPRSFVDDFESKYSFHPLDDFPPPEEYRHFTKIYPSRASRGT
ncbi:WAS/WASL-interacting protein family member 2 [Takifugu flavidus]|uniref:WAS/WASL-interacting protein family member 2 n=1 Tax=Takifugu flavidus TaxID=433684 RepID=A0A5C6MGU9_9TELE|nr:WAS/WASL-interacting protein family member 2 [Takifugu flavidus]